MSGMILRSAATALASLLAVNSALGSTIANCNADAILVFDASASMAGIGQSQLSVPRIEEARTAIRQSLPEITPFRRVGLIVYGPGPNGTCGNIDLRLAPTPNAAKRIIAEIEATEPDGGTPLARAVQEAAQVLNPQDPGIVVLVTDGADTCDGQTCEVAAALGPTNVTVHVIGFRLPYDTLVFSDHTTHLEQSEDQRQRLNTETRCLADQTGGTFVTADSTEGLVNALQEMLTCPVVSDTRARHSPWKWS